MLTENKEMKRLFLFTVVLLLTQVTMNAARQTKMIDRVEPADWFVGMKNPTLQLMVYGRGIRDAENVSTDYQGVRIDSLVRLDSPNYLLIYMNVKDAQPGTMRLTFKLKNEKGRPKTEVVEYRLKQREMRGEERRGFDISDVLYLLMPDRFAQGPNHQRQL